MKRSLIVALWLAVGALFFTVPGTIHKLEVVSVEARPGPNIDLDAHVHRVTFKVGTSIDGACGGSADFTSPDPRASGVALRYRTRTSDDWIDAGVFPFDPNNGFGVGYIQSGEPIWVQARAIKNGVPDLCWSPTMKYEIPIRYGSIPEDIRYADLNTCGVTR